MGIPEGGALRGFGGRARGSSGEVWEGSEGIWVESTWRRLTGGLRGGSEGTL